MRLLSASKSRSVHVWPVAYLNHQELIWSSAIAWQNPHCEEVLEAVESPPVIGLVPSSCAGLPEVLDLLLQLDHLELTSDGQSLKHSSSSSLSNSLASRLLTIRDIDQPAVHGNRVAVLVHLHPSATSHPMAGAI
jgi:hypothetical protein